MLQYFSESAIIPVLDEKADKLAQAGLDIVRQFAANKSQEKEMSLVNATAMFAGTDTSNYEKNNKLFMEKFMQYCMEGGNYTYSMEAVKNPQVRRGGFMDKFNAIVSQVITPVLPGISTMLMNTIAEVRDINYGDTALFTLESDDIFLVNEIAEGINRGASQRLYRTEKTINATPKEITIDIDWYRVAAGTFDFGSWAYRVSLAFTTYISLLAYNLFDGTYASIPAAFKAASFTDANFLGLAQRVEAANSYTQCYVLGTKAALGNVLPNDSYLRMQLGEEYAKIGYLGAYKGYRLLEMEQMISPQTLNSTADFVFDNTRMYFIPVSMSKPVKIVFEGSAFVTEDTAQQTPDKVSRLKVSRRIGAGLATASRYAILDTGA